MTCGFMEEIAAAAIFFSPKKKRIRRLSYKKVNSYNGKCIKIHNKTENVATSLIEHVTTRLLENNVTTSVTELD